MLFRQLHKKIVSLLVISTFFLIMTVSTHAEVIWDKPPHIDIQTDKIWTVSFNKPVDPASVHANSVYVTDQKGNKVVTYSVPYGDKVMIPSPTEGYIGGQTYTLHITNAVRNSDGVSLKENIRKNFTIEFTGETYDVMTIHPDGSLSIAKSFPTYAQAVANLEAGQAIQFGDSIVKMPDGIVVTKPTTASSLTNIYPNESFRAADTYVPDDTELEYVDSTDTYVKVKIAGKTGFIKHENSELIPMEAVRNRSFYTTNNGVLTHSIYSNKSGSFASYQAGKAPAFMTDGVEYYSWDSINFHTADGEKVGAAYQYFQFLPARSKTHYTANEIDTYIVNMLKDLETRYPNSSTYQNASKRSKLLGLGSYLKKIEKEQKVNALTILALAQHESSYGLSQRALEFNNLFGLRVYDDHPDSFYFKSVEANIDELLNAFLNKNYIPPNAAYANGAVFGNKALGFNVKYASDPYWGAKAAGHLYRIDKMMGGKDLANAYKIGFTTEPLNVRVGAGTENPVAFRYNKTGLPVIITGQATLHPWLKIISDSNVHDELFVHGDYIEERQIVR